MQVHMQSSASAETRPHLYNAGELPADLLPLTVISQLPSIQEHSG